MAGSDRLRKDFEMLSEATRPTLPDGKTLDRYLSFLDAMHRIFPLRRPPAPFVNYPRVLM
jgi:hypothetical protein